MFEMFGTVTFFQLLPPFRGAVQVLLQQVYLFLGVDAAARLKGVENMVPFGDVHWADLI